MLFHEHLVQNEVGESKLVEILEGCLESFVSEAVNLLIVHLLGSLIANADHALHQGAGLGALIVDHRLLRLGLSGLLHGLLISHFDLFVSGN